MLKCVSPRLSFYADDSRIYRVVMNDDDAAKNQNDLDAHRKVTQGKLLKINMKKSHKLMLTGGSERPARKYTKSGEQSLKSVICEKHPGVGVDSRLSFNEHIAKKSEAGKHPSSNNQERIFEHHSRYSENSAKPYSDRTYSILSKFGTPNLRSTKP